MVLKHFFSSNIEPFLISLPPFLVFPLQQALSLRNQQMYTPFDLPHRGF